jgi:uncharacterized damage-inducible protein DinB
VERLCSGARKLCAEAAGGIIRVDLKNRRRNLGPGLPAIPAARLHPVRFRALRSNQLGGNFMAKIFLGALLGFLLAVPLAAQTGQQAPPKDFSAWLRNSYGVNRKFIARTAEKMPEEFYGLRPGAQPEVRTFGQLIGHLANFNFRWCSDAKGEKNPMEKTDFEKVTAKPDLIKALNSALTYCDGAYAMLTDANSMDLVQGTRDDGTKVPVLRISRLISNLAHNNEHYGNLVTYMRIKSIVPPSSEPR